MENFDKKLQAFIELAEKETQHRMHEKGYDNLIEIATKKGCRAYYEFGFDNGLKYIRVWKKYGPSQAVHSFVEKATGIIYGADGWKKPNFKRAYGTLDTINDWAWGEYYAVSKTGIDTLVPKDERKRNA
jgi:hypothetical protein